MILDCLEDNPECLQCCTSLTVSSGVSLSQAGADNLRDATEPACLELEFSIDGIK